MGVFTRRLSLSGTGRVLNFLTFLTVIHVQGVSYRYVSAVPHPNRGSRLLPPPQALVPPHREEGQSLDDIIYGRSFSADFFPFAKKTPVDVPLPTSTTTTTPSPTFPPPPPPLPFRANGNTGFGSQNTFGQSAESRGFHLAPNTIRPSPPQPPRVFTNSPNSINSILPPPFQGSPRASFPTPIKSTFPPPSPVSLQTSGLTSAEEIKVPQPIKHRTPQRKQYSKADLVAAANSLKPAGFDFNKVLIVTSANSSQSARNKQVRLQLFDTPVFNQLKPLMEMLRRANFDLGSGSVSDTNKVLVIIPKGNDVSTEIPSGRSANPFLNNAKPQVKHQLHSAPSVQFSKSSPSPLTSKVILPKASSKPVTTPKPKPFPSFAPTKPVAKFESFQSTKLITKKSEKSPDLQTAATSANKLSQRPGGSSPPASDKRTQSSKGGDNYSFSYAVKNDAYKDVKSHTETRDGDTVAGEYSMLEPDGYTRIVRYTVDSDHGFKASVKRIPPSS